MLGQLVALGAHVKHLCIMEYIIKKHIKNPREFAPRLLVEDGSHVNMASGLKPNVG